MSLREAQGGRFGYEETDGFGGEEGLSVSGSARPESPPSPFGGERHPDTCSLVVFGVTGDLTHRMLVPALYDLGCHGVLPTGTTLVGYGRQELSDEDFRVLMRKAIDDHYGAEVVDGPLCDRILQTPRYVQGQFDDPDGYRRLAAALEELDGQGGRGNRMFYLATPPSQFDVIVRQLAIRKQIHLALLERDLTTVQARQSGLDDLTRLLAGFARGYGFTVCGTD